MVSWHAAAGGGAGATHAALRRLRAAPSVVPAPLSSRSLRSGLHKDAPGAGKGEPAMAMTRDGHLPRHAGPAGAGDARLGAGAGACRPTADTEETRTAGGRGRRLRGRVTGGAGEGGCRLTGDTGEARTAVGRGHRLRVRVTGGAGASGG